jgi:hypothetical protein
MKQGPFPRRRFCCPHGSSSTTGPSATLPAGTRLRGSTAYTRPSLPGHNPADPGPGRASPVPAPTVRPFRSLYPGGFLTAALPGSSRLPWPSPFHPRLGSPLSRSRGLKLTGRQDSLHATDRSLARPHGTLDAGLQRRAFPPGAASLLPGALALTGTGLSPAGGCELRFGSDHVTASPPNLWAHDGAFMEPSGCNRWQSAANRPSAKAAETSEIRCRRLPPVAETPKW